MKKIPGHPRCHGVSLVEALVAMAVMAFGMLALVRVQATLRFSSDLAKQRTEATHIATEELENLRLFTSVRAGNPAWDDIAGRTVDPYLQPDGTSNTRYRLVRTVGTSDGMPQKVVTVQVSWTDRTGTRQSIRIDTVVAGVDPGLSGLLSMVP